VPTDNFKSTENIRLAGRQLPLGARNASQEVVNPALDLIFSTASATSI